MKLFIPELGTKLTLIKDWTIPIAWEERNNSLIEFAGIDRTEIDRLYKEESYNQIWEDSYKALGVDKSRYNDSNSYRNEKWPLLDKWQQKERKRRYEATRDFLKKSCPTYTIPKGSVLEIDRIYIRKGNEKFSSITFKWRLKKVIRFWVSLDIANTMEFKL